MLCRNTKNKGKNLHTFYETMLHVISLLDKIYLNSQLLCFAQMKEEWTQYGQGFLNSGTTNVLRQIIIFGGNLSCEL